MDRVTKGMEEYAAAYLDDLVIFSSTGEEHLAHVQAVLGRLRDAGLTAKARKCQFEMSKCMYLGHVVRSGTVQPQPTKIEAVKKFPRPETKKQVRTFLGLTGYYRRFIPNYASTAVPLTDLTKKAAPNRIAWTRECDKAIRCSRSSCVSRPSSGARTSTNHSYSKQMLLTGGCFSAESAG